MIELTERIREDQRRIYLKFLKEELQREGIEDKMPCFEDVELHLDVDLLKDVYRGKDLTDYVDDISQDMYDLISEVRSTARASQDLNGFLLDSKPADFADHLLMATYLTTIGYLLILKANFSLPKQLSQLNFLNDAGKILDSLPYFEEVTGIEQDYLIKRAEESKTIFSYLHTNAGKVYGLFKRVTERFMREYHADAATLAEPSMYELKRAKLLALLGEKEEN